ncbi:MAG TPA: NAD(P)/FAD-dependent oxidoreductase [Rhodanobacteraceae bacterium]|nr:NAD(P)/FAD-dependent oxidoreductase [Rhodanobacteraceae bacterium]
MKRELVIAGAGLVGSLLAVLLAQRGMSVRVIEKRADPRQAGFAGGRSINLALAERGLDALRAAGLADTVLASAVMMRGRMVHDRDGSANLQRYGIDDSEVIWSVSRGGLNALLLDAAEAAGAQIEFDCALIDARFGDSDVTLTLQGTDGSQRERGADSVIGADGAGSALRRAMHAATPLGEHVEPLPHGYKELEIPSASNGLQNEFANRFSIEPHALHIWPRGGYMCIALPNCNGSFTVTLFLPQAGGTASFAALPDADAARRFFEQDFADLLPLLPDFDADFTEHPTGTLATLHLERWHHGGQALLIGDAAHAIVPFHGQGMNAGFEDAALLAPLLADAGDDLATVYADFQRQRQPNCDAIARMALENYVEMRDSVADPHYLLKRQLGQELASRCPRHYMARYRLVTFTRLPYAWCEQRGQQQDALLKRLLAGRNDLAGFDFAAATALTASELAPLPASALVRS